ncbi:MAG: TlpA disulfide reductase family protein [Chitinophagia bacterium]|jgi:peroxiredoxin
MKSNTKKIFIACLIVLTSFHIKAQSLEITANLKNVPDNMKVTLLDGMANKDVDSAVVMGGKFVLKTTTENIGIYVISFKTIRIQIPIFVGNDKITMEGDVQKVPDIIYKGSVSQELYQSFMKNLDPKMIAYFNIMTTANSEKNTAKKDSLNKLVELQTKNIINDYLALSKKYNESPVTTFFLFQFANIFPAIKASLTEYYALLQGDAKKGPFAAVIEKSLQTAEVGKVGSVMPDFKQNDVNGKSVSLTSFKGKFVLIDFWASWCGPCRAENPNVVKTFNKFKDKNFTILSVSLDQDKAKWLEAIKKDGLTWTHVSDLKYWNNEVAVQFGVQSIPASYLIDPNGVVIGRDLRGDDLTKALEAVIK